MIILFATGAPVWVLGLYVLWIPLYYLAYPMYMAHSWKSFDKEFTMRFQKGDYKGLLEQYKGQWFLRRFGPRSEMLGKLGLIHAAMERYREAEHAFECAIDAARLDPSDQLYFNLANIKYELGKYDDAMQIYKSLRSNSPYQQSVRTQLALIDLHKGEHGDQARQFLERERERASGVLRTRIDDALARHS